MAIRKIRLTENEIGQLIERVVERTINESQNDTILLGIAEAITNLGEIRCHIGDNELYGQIKFGEYDVDIDFNVDSSSYYYGGDDGDYYNEPTPKEFEQGNTDVNVTKIWVNTEEADDVMEIEDTGIVANALKSVIYIDEDSYPYMSDEDLKPDYDD